MASKIQSSPSCMSSTNNNNSSNTSPINNNSNTSTKMIDSNELPTVRDYFLARTRSALKTKNPLRNLSQTKLKSIENWINNKVSQQHADSEYYVRF
jgi:hypothetical protein